MLDHMIPVRVLPPLDLAAGDVPAYETAPPAEGARIRRLDGLDLAHGTFDGRRRLDVRAFDLAADGLAPPTTLRCGRHQTCRMSSAGIGGSAGPRSRKSIASASAWSATTTSDLSGSRRAGTSPRITRRHAVLWSTLCDAAYSASVCMPPAYACASMLIACNGPAKGIEPMCILKDMSTPTLPPLVNISQLARHLGYPVEELGNVAVTLAAIAKDPVGTIREETRRVEANAREESAIIAKAEARNAAARARERAEAEARAAKRIEREQKQAAAYSAASPDATGLHRV